MKEYLYLFLKGAGMGAANVIPGVSGGTVALITGIFEKLINSIRAFDGKAIGLLLKGRFRDFSTRINLDFLFAVFLGIGVSILSLARLLEFLFEYYPVQVWAYFFGLILASVFYVGRTIRLWNILVWLFFLAGAAGALSISFLTPATENESFIYLFVSGIVAMCSMILPGLSGSYVLVLMGEYELVMIEAVNNLRMDVLLPVVAGALFGLVAFSHLLSWIFKRYRDQTIALLTGFILGSLATIWPWKEPVFKSGPTGAPVLQPDGEMIVQGYRWLLPDSLSVEVIATICILLAGVLTMVLIEKIAGNHKPE